MSRSNGVASREAAEQALADDHADAIAVEHAGDQADAFAQSLADAGEQAGEPTGEQAPTRSSRRAAADDALARTSGERPLVLAEGCEWHKCTAKDGSYLGKSAITVESDAQKRVREYLTWVPAQGRTQRIPTYGAFPIMDAGDLD